MKKISKLFFLLFIILVADRALADDTYINVLIYMNEDIHNRAEDLAAEDQDLYIKNLQDLAAKSQEDLINLLKSSDQVRGFESFFISNLVHLEAEEDFVEDLRNREDVRAIEEIKESMTSKGETKKAKLPKTWNMDLMNVQKAKDKYGVSGKGITIGFIDSAVDFSHPEIEESFRGYGKDGKNKTSHNYIDVLNKDGGQRTHATGVVSVAMGREDGYVKGLAPGAKWILARTFDEKNTSNDLVIKAAQWMIAPDGDPSMRPDIINNSWGGDSSGEKWFEDILRTWDQLGIFSVFASGNNLKGQSKPGSIENPASLPGAFSVGSITEDQDLSSFSKLGPSNFAPGQVKPEIVGPGENIVTALPDGRYGLSRGTSLAAPHISGLAALIKELRPEITSRDIRTILIKSASPLTSEAYPTSPNMGFGYGLPDADKALGLAKDMRLRTRIQGVNRFDTAISISKSFFPEGADIAYIANGNSYIDALVMAPLTSLEDGPLLLAGKDTYDPKLVKEIRRLGVKKLVLIGGENSLSSSLEEKFKEEIGLETTRISGRSRFDTSLVIGQSLAREKEIKEVYLVNAFNEADAISAAGPSSALTRPLLLSSKDKLDPGVKDLIMDLGVEKVYLIGGENSLTKDLEDQIRDLGSSVTRLGGANRYATSIKINEEAYESGEEIFMANGINPVDALAAGPLAGREKRPLVLTGEKALDPSVKAYIKNRGCKEIKIFGGQNSVSQDLEDQLIFD